MAQHREDFSRGFLILARCLNLTSLFLNHQDLRQRLFRKSFGSFLARCSNLTGLIHSSSPLWLSIAKTGSRLCSNLTGLILNSPVTAEHRKVSSEFISKPFFAQCSNLTGFNSFIFSVMAQHRKESFEKVFRLVLAYA